MDLLAGYGSDESLDSDVSDKDDLKHESSHSPEKSQNSVDEDHQSKIDDNKNINNKPISITDLEDRTENTLEISEEINSHGRISNSAFESSHSIPLQPNDEQTIKPTMIQSSDQEQIQTSLISDHRQNPPLLLEEAERREKEEFIEINSCVEADNSIVCLSSEYGEYGRLKVICAKSAHFLGRRADDLAIGMGRKTVIEKDVIIRGDLEQVHIGQYTYIGFRTVLRPPWRIEFVENKRTCQWSKMVVGSYVICGRDCVIESLCIGSFVRIGDGCVLGKHTVLKDCCLVCPGAVLPPYMVVPPFAIVEGAPARIVGELPESANSEYKLLAERICKNQVFRKEPVPN
mmetsp:Transcript_12233/g.15730  ORF Transcript_12233/g.15730 Transcript_12233/m.15730 type:complete len:345 (-) Transcript_12233:135-1169(-)